MQKSLLEEQRALKVLTIFEWYVYKHIPFVFLYESDSQKTIRLQNFNLKFSKTERYRKTSSIKKGQGLEYENYQAKQDVKKH